MEFYKSSQVEYIKKYRKRPHKFIEDMYGIKLKWYQILYLYSVGRALTYFSREAREERIFNNVTKSFMR